MKDKITAGSRKEPGLISACVTFCPEQNNQAGYIDTLNRIKW